MVEIVTSRNKFDAEALLEAVEYACQYSEAQDEVRRLQTGSVIPSKMTMRLSEAMSLVHEIRADELHDERGEALEDKATRDFEERFEVKA